MNRSDWDLLHSQLRMMRRKERRMFRRRRRELEQDVAELKATVFALVRVLAASGHLTATQMMEVLHQPPPVLEPIARESGAS
ncbi:MAG: hypothetical protein H6805_12115 [Planctomycetes bacterium]|nr:hypothetical protein [Planctomycetota bacterium]MCB9826552.1 hypothetical protein [Planctomycetota bacterium]